MTLNDSIKLIKFGIAKETVPGTAETTPDEYVYLINDETIKVNRTFDTLKPSSQRDLMLSTALGYTTAIRPQIWALPNINGFGHFLTGAIGLDTPTQLGGTTAYKHTITLTDILPSYTIWNKAGIFEKKTVYNQVNRLTINSPQNRTVTCTAEFVGGKITTCSDFGSPTYTTTNPFKSSMGVLTFGQSGAKVRTNLTEFNITIDNGIRIEEGLVHGQYYPVNVMSGDRVVSGDLTFWMENDDEALRFWEGVDTQPTASEPVETPGLVALDAKWTGTVIDGSYHYELEFAMDKVQLTAFDYITTGTRIAGKATWQAVKGTGTNLLVGYLTNTRSTAY